MGRITTAIRHLIPYAAPPVRCSVCESAQSAKRRLISGPRFYLCEVCIQRALTTVDVGDSRLLPRNAICAFCRGSGDGTGVALGASAYWICNSCARRAAEVLHDDSGSRKRAT
jgi:ClpX C4-type zinc finger protein